MCGLIMHKVQLYSIGFDFNINKITLSSGDCEKINPSYLSTDWGESLPCTAFLVPSYPYFPLIELGAYYLAFNEFVGPMKVLHFLIASGATSSIPTAKSDVIKSIRVGKKDFPSCYA